MEELQHVRVFVPLYLTDGNWIPAVCETGKRRLPKHFRHGLLAPLLAHPDLCYFHRKLREAEVHPGGKQRAEVWQFRGHVQAAILRLVHGVLIDEQRFADVILDTLRLVKVLEGFNAGFFVVTAWTAATLPCFFPPNARTSKQDALDQLARGLSQIHQFLSDNSPEYAARVRKFCDEAVPCLTDIVEAGVSFTEMNMFVAQSGVGDVLGELVDTLASRHTQQTGVGADPCSALQNCGVSQLHAITTVLLQTVNVGQQKVGSGAVIIVPSAQAILQTTKQVDPFAKATLFSLVCDMIMVTAPPAALAAFDETLDDRDDLTTDHELFCILCGLETNMGVCASDEVQLLLLVAKLTSPSRGLRQVVCMAVSACVDFARCCAQWGLLFVSAPIPSRTRKPPEPAHDGPFLQFDSENEEEETTMFHAPMARNSKTLLHGTEAFLRAMKYTHMQRYMSNYIQLTIRSVQRPDAHAVGLKAALWTWTCCASRSLFPVVFAYGLPTSELPAWTASEAAVKNFMRVLPGLQQMKPVVLENRSKHMTGLLGLVSRLTTHTCTYCNKNLSFRQIHPCPGCKTTQYCSERCQQGDWGVRHKVECIRAQQAPQTAAQTVAKTVAKAVAKTVAQETTQQETSQ